ncbi:MAG: hypothetical protein J1F20_00020 [Muribaculaceae bacterium]|nr:hypothetical protein [Muribaculaceae bacterium]
MDNKEDKIKEMTPSYIAAHFEEKVHADLFKFLKDNNRIDAHVPVCPDVEEAWPEIAREYLADAAREFNQYPVVTLGWIMFVGMAMAQYWDEDWVGYANEKRFYENIREKRGFDNIDDTVLQDILHFEGEAAEKESAVVSECASRVYSMLMREHIEPGTDTALGCLIAALHQMYLAGMATQLKTLGYRMTKMGE